MEEAVVDAGWIEKCDTPVLFEVKRPTEDGGRADTETGPTLNPDQQHAVEQVYQR